MKRHIFAALIGFATALAALAGPLWWMRQSAAKRATEAATLALQAQPTKPIASTTSPQAAIEAWTAARTDDSRSSALAAAKSLESLDVQQCQALAESMLETHFDKESSLWKDLLSHWATLDGAGVVRWAFGREKVPTAALGDAGKLWAAHQPGAASAWWRSIKDTDAGKKLAKSDANVYLWFVPHDLPVALDGAVTRLFENQSDGRLSSILREVAGQPEHTKAFAAAIGALEPSLLDNKATKRNIKSVLYLLRKQLLNQEPQGWLDWARTHPEMAKVARDSESDSADIMSAAAPEAIGQSAAQLLATVDAGHRAETLKDIVKAWATKDIDAAGTWLGQQGRGPETWDAVQSFAKIAVTDDPQAAFTWTATISDASRREKAEREVFLHWHSKKASEAMNWLNNQSGWTKGRREDVEERLAVLSVSH